MRSDLNARFDKEERAALKRLAKENGTSEAGALRLLVRWHMAASATSAKKAARR